MGMPRGSARGAIGEQRDKHNEGEKMRVVLHAYLIHVIEMFCV